MHPPQEPDRDDTPEERPLQGQVRHESRSALVPKEVADGVFSNGVLILTGPHEVVIDFLLRMGEQQRVAARVILPHLVARQFAAALEQDLRVYQSQFGPLPKVPRPVQPPALEAGPAGDVAMDEHPENLPEPPRAAPSAEDIYHDLKLPDEMLAGAYANGVLIRHSGTEFCFDFITNIYPRSAVSARVFLAAPHVGPLLQSLKRSLHPPTDGPRTA